MILFFHLYNITSVYTCVDVGISIGLTVIQWSWSAKCNYGMETYLFSIIRALSCCVYRLAFFSV